MKSIIENGTLTLFFEGELNSFTSEAAEKEIDEILSKKGFESVRIDMDGLRYASSAGLRIIVRIKQQYDDLALVNVPNDVYEVLEMVGFHNLMKIQRK